MNSYYSNAIKQGQWTRPTVVNREMHQRLVDGVKVLDHHRTLLDKAGMSEELLRELVVTHHLVLFPTTQATRTSRVLSDFPEVADKLVVDYKIQLIDEQARLFYGKCLASILHTDDVATAMSDFFTKEREQAEQKVISLVRRGLLPQLLAPYLLPSMWCFTRGCRYRFTRQMNSNCSDKKELVNYLWNNLADMHRNRYFI